jgi:hypothetical protein
MDRELTRVELDELLPLYALDALDGEEREQVARYVERDDSALAEVLSLREAVALLPPPDTRAPASLWSTLESSLDAPSTDSPRPEPLVSLGAARVARRRDRRSYRIVAVALAVAATVAIAVLGIQVAGQQDRIDELAAEMHGDAMQQQALAARSAKDAHVIQLAAASGAGRAEIVMLPTARVTSWTTTFRRWPRARRTSCGPRSATPRRHAWCRSECSAAIRGSSHSGCRRPRSCSK